MRHKKLKLSAILLLGLGLTGLQAQTMHVQESNGTQTAYALSNVRKMIFSSGNVTLQKTNNSTWVYALSGLRYLRFTDYTTGIAVKQMPAGNATLITFPNPVADVLTLDLTGSESKSGTIDILSLEGEVLYVQKTSNTGIVTLNLSQLPQGIYLCRYTNEKEIKTVKIIKQ